MGEIKFPNGKQTRRMYVTALVRPMCVKPRDVGSQVTITTAHPLHRVIKALRFSRLFEYLKDELIVPATEEEVYYAPFCCLRPFQTTVETLSKIWEKRSIPFQQ